MLSKAVQCAPLSATVNAPISSALSSTSPAADGDTGIKRSPWCGWLVDEVKYAYSRDVRRQADQQQKKTL
ncbi:hypothetical protein TSOC_003997 [Tetrabaena socialis]|uniref:Uncharacterized protein n=1 Tax=Tetrabaena socialis TaxID=47790 RepID=A0A2J8AA74_9CHLO|nr:hypothetical protein TSOC_003997 [Tetrabaena socialis]|eukprot:PNH09411.1 hypothetical protein TSOC_003997 [Tetrabaena socialis]